MSSGLQSPSPILFSASDGCALPEAIKRISKFNMSRIQGVRYSIVSVVISNSPNTHMA
jgi:hypothetical protein